MWCRTVGECELRHTTAMLRRSYRSEPGGMISGSCTGSSASGVPVALAMVRRNPEKQMLLMVA